MGRAIGICGAWMAGARVAGQLTYIPKHTINGKEVNARCTIPVYINSHRGTNQRTGEKGRTDEFRLVAWGKLADVCCKSLPKGNALDIDSRPHSYKGKLFNMDGSPRLDVAGVTIEITKTAFTIKELVFGEESSKLIAEEVSTGRRPLNWDKPNHPDFNIWIGVLQARQKAVWDGRSATFGYARVVIPTGQGVQLDFSTPAAPVDPTQNQFYPGPAAPVQFYQGQPAQSPQFHQPVQGTPMFQQTAQPSFEEQIMAEVNKRLAYMAPAAAQPVAPQHYSQTQFQPQMVAGSAPPAGQLLF